MRPIAPKRLAAVAAGLAGVALLVLAATGAGALGPHQTSVRCGPRQTSGSSGTHGGGGLMIPVTLDQVTDESSLVVVGTVAAFRSCTLGTPDSIFTLVTVVPEEVVKGNAGQTVELTVPGGEYGGYGFAVGTSPEFTAGERTLVFAGPDGANLVPVQGYQGKLNVAPDGRVRAVGTTLDRLVSAVRSAAKGAVTDSENFSLGQASLASTNYSAPGYAWPTSAIPVPFNMNVTAGRPAQLSAQDVRNAIANALHTWQNEGGAYFAFGPLAETAVTSSDNGCTGFNDTNDTTFGINAAHASGTLAVTYTCYNPVTLVILDTDVEIDVDHFGSAWRTNGQGNCDGYLRRGDRAAPRVRPRARAGPSVTTADRLYGLPGAGNGRELRWRSANALRRRCSRCWVTLRADRGNASSGAGERGRNPQRYRYSLLE